MRASAAVRMTRAVKTACDQRTGHRHERWEVPVQTACNRTSFHCLGSMIMAKKELSIPQLARRAWSPVAGVIAKPEAKKKSTAPFHWYVSNVSRISQR